MSWQAIEMLGYAHFASLGYRVLVPLVRNDSIDFVAEMSGTFTRVNVKVAGLKSRKQGNSWSISLSSGAGRRRGDEGVDIYLAWLPDQKRFIELPGDFFRSTCSKSKLIPKAFLMNCNTPFSLEKP